MIGNQPLMESLQLGQLYGDHIWTVLESLVSTLSAAGKENKRQSSALFVELDSFVDEHEKAEWFGRILTDVRVLIRALKPVAPGNWRFKLSCTFVAGCTFDDDISRLNDWVVSEFETFKLEYSVYSKIERNKDCGQFLDMVIVISSRGCAICGY